MLTLLRRIDALIVSRTALPSWSVVMQLGGGVALVIALVGFVWDVGWHADLGRDKNLLTVPHLMILAGLTGIGASGVAAIAMATATRAQAGRRLWRLHVPYSAAALTAFGAGAVAGFPIDDLWHRTYGIDVTMWSPTHLLMIGGASLSPIALALAAGEARWPHGAGFSRVRRYLLVGAVMIGLSTFQLEFDMGVPQWQALYQPVLIAAAAGIGLVAARAWLGRGGALYAVLVFLGMRAGVALLVGPLLGHALPRFPTYLGFAAGVEIAFLLERRLRPWQLALAAGVTAAVIGLPLEWAWSHLWGDEPWQPRLLPLMWVPVLASAAGAVLGFGAGRAPGGRPPQACPASSCRWPRSHWWWRWPSHSPAPRPRPPPICRPSRPGRRSASPPTALASPPSARTTGSKPSCTPPTRLTTRTGSGSRPGRAARCATSTWCAPAPASTARAGRCRPAGPGRRSSSSARASWSRQRR